MYGAIRLVALAWAALSASMQARADVAPPAEAPVATPAGGRVPGVAPSSETGIADATSRLRTRVGISFLTTARGKANASNDMAPAYGVSPSVDYRIVRGLGFGVVPQILFNIKHQAASALRQYDFMARVAYTRNSSVDAQGCFYLSTWGVKSKQEAPFLVQAAGSVSRGDSAKAARGSHFRMVSQATRRVGTV
jgi:hypothetical protein